MIFSVRQNDNQPTTVINIRRAQHLALESNMLVHILQCNRPNVALSRRQTDTRPVFHCCCCVLTICSIFFLKYFYTYIYFWSDPQTIYLASNRMFSTVVQTKHNPYSKIVVWVDFISLVPEIIWVFFFLGVAVERNIFLRNKTIGNISLLIQQLSGKEHNTIFKFSMRFSVMREQSNTHKNRIYSAIKPYIIVIHRQGQFKLISLCEFSQQQKQKRLVTFVATKRLCYWDVQNMFFLLYNACGS